MANWDALTDDIAERFDLGPEARVLVHEVLSLIGAQPRGIDGFLDKVKAAGFEEKEASWLGAPYPMALSAREVRQALGEENVTRIADTAGVADDVASRVLGYAIPKIINLLAQDDAIHTAILTSAGSAHPNIAGFASMRGGQMPPRGSDVWRDAGGLRLVIPGAALVVTAAILGYAITSGTAGDHASIQYPAQNAPAASPQTAAGPSYGGHESGGVAPSGSVANNANTAATTEELKSVLGAGNLNEVYAVSEEWFKNLSAASNKFAREDVRKRFASREFKVGEKERAWMMASALSAQVPEFGVAAAAGSGAPHMSAAPSTANAGPSGNAPASPNVEATGAAGSGAPHMSAVPSTANAGPSGNAPASRNVAAAEAAVEFPAIDFPPNSANVPARSLSQLQRVAQQIKQLPAGTRIELNGYTHGERNPAFNLKLSQKRAEAVARILVRDGVSPAMLNAQGKGSSPSLASTANGTMEGRSSTRTESSRNDRRVEFRVIQQRP